ncbi:DUF5691 domain-containing protein [Actinoallomurus rhizosphaericola]|uniref:DUF5691 domain-containing protein n=1 Tax=Actinoallomurus rhizosphaericola TaxID=2952536 RepID=UPI0020931503|nr:DUF5691 domain-containing protein [Actinoallomurus rhizosphaericola]MCO5999475.1 DUF5691 domain-containing protein [Actinoallomurus rhizosphaericola]
MSAALLGTRRRPVPPLDEVPGGPADPAARLLDQAALLTVRRRAGRRPVSAEPTAPAPAETAPVVPDATADRLRRILSGEHARVLPEWLEAAARSGRRVPPRLLPDLLHKGRADRALRPSIARAAGRRGVWLAMQNLDWAYLVVAGGGEEVEDPGVWSTGTRAQRMAHLLRSRATDPAAARTTLSSTWGREPAPERARFLTAFERGLSLADEEFLEAALDDRGLEVRRIAADLLARLPGSAYARRMTERALACLHPVAGPAGGLERIAVEPPEHHDEGMQRDGIPYHAIERVGNRAGWLREILARTPPSTWTALFGLPPERVAALPVTTGARPTPDEHVRRDVHLGWARAAARQRDAAWARTLLAGDVVLGDVPVLADLLDVLPVADREDHAADAVRRIEDHAARLTVLERVPGPWAGALADVTIAALADPAPGRFPADLCRLAGERLAPAVAPRLDELARRHPGHRPLGELADVLRFRHDMLEELR